MILEAVKDYWEYQKSDRPAGVIGMSAIGHCARQLAYVKHLTPHDQPDWRAKIIFDDGNRHHDQIRLAIREGLVLSKSCFQLIGEEQEVNIGALIGHVDGVLVHDDVECTGQGHESMLLEVKSMNDRAFSEFRRTRKLQYEYECQVSAYCRGSGYGKALIVVKNKNTGEMDEMLFEANDELLDARLDVLNEVINSQYPEEIARDWIPDDNGKLPWQCGYCPYVERCWKDFNLQELSRHKYIVSTETTKNVQTLQKLVTESVTPVVRNVADLGNTIGTGLACTTPALDKEQVESGKGKTKGRTRRKKGLR